MSNSPASLFHLAKDETQYRLLSTSKELVSTASFEGHEIVKVDPKALTLLARQAFHDVSHLLRTSHLANLRAILDDPEASDNDRFVATELLKNATVAAGGTLPMCQDTGTAIVVAHKGDRIWTGGDDQQAL